MPAKKKILVVDDDRKVTEGIGTFLSSLGHEMILALDGDKAMQFIKEEKPALVLLDIRLPRIDGISILETLRTKYKNTKVFIITAYSKEVKWRCDEIGYDKFFEKPIELDPLLNAIKEVITKKKPEEEKPLEGIPKARVLFIEPNVNIYGFTCGLFESREFNPGEYEVKVAYSLREAMELFHPSSLYEFVPDIVVLYDFNTRLEDIDKFADYMMSTSFKPKKVIMHGVFPRTDYEIMALEKKGMTYCSQNVLTDEDFRKINKRLIDFVAKECVNLGLVKK